MPYKDPERKRQWEREHRVQRNAQRRKPFSRSGGHNSSGVIAPRADEVTDGRSDGAIIATFAMGLAFVLFLLFSGWCFLRSRRHSKPFTAPCKTLPEPSDCPQRVC